MDLPNTKISLARPDYQESCTKLFSSLLNNAEYSDVTLACEDGAFIHGHKFLLSSASPYFRFEIQTFDGQTSRSDISFRLLMTGGTDNQVLHVQASSNQVLLSSISVYLATES